MFPRGQLGLARSVPLLLAGARVGAFKSLYRIESIPTNLLLRGHNIRLRCGSKAGPDVRAFRERTGHRSLSCILESCLALCTGPPYVSDRDVRGETRKNSCHFALAASGAGTIVVRIELYALPVTLDIQSTLLTLHFHAS